MGQYKYTHGFMIFKGAFNIYQAKSGKIILAMGARITVLTLDQINDLSIDCYLLSDFDVDLFNKIYYENSKNK